MERVQRMYIQVLNQIMVGSMHIMVHFHITSNIKYCNDFQI
jgi:hypothetical protein